MTRFLPIALLSFSFVGYTQEGFFPTQVIITADSTDAPKLTADDLVLDINHKKQFLMSFNPVISARAQVALLIDDGLRSSVMRELKELRAFVANLPPGMEVYVGYMSNGHVIPASYFTTDHIAAAEKMRPPMGGPKIDGTPYFSLSDFVKHWPEQGPVPKARFVLMVTDGIDLYNGSTEMGNQYSPFVEAAQKDAQRAGVSVSSIYLGDAEYQEHPGWRDPTITQIRNAILDNNRVILSGQSYLSQVAEATGGHAYYEGLGNPVIIRPILQMFTQFLAESYMTTFSASGKDLINLQVRSNVPRLKIRAPHKVKPGNLGPGAESY